MIDKIKRLINFMTYDIWRIREGEVSKGRFTFYNIIKSISLSIYRFAEDRITNRASALTYSTLLAIVPILAILFAIARGFGFSNIVESQFGSDDTMHTLMRFVDSYLAETKSGVFIGVGLVLLLWTVLNLTSEIERTFNYIWEVKKQRSMYRKVTDYFSMFLLLPILLVLSGGVSIYVNSFMNQVGDYVFIGTLARILIHLAPFVLMWFIFTGLYIFMPNTRVKFRYAFISGVLAGTAFQIFQYLYISGQIWVTKYNAIYGSFAAIPLLLLWLQLSWTICLFGVELTYAGQNINNYSFDRDTRNISRRYRDYLSLLVMSVIAKALEGNKPPQSAQQISKEHHVPIRLTKEILSFLQDVNLISEVATDEKSDELTYLPAVDINQLDVATVLDKLESFGSEDFKIDLEEHFEENWKVLICAKEDYFNEIRKILLKDL